MKQLLSQNVKIDSFIVYLLLLISEAERGGRQKHRDRWSPCWFTPNLSTMAEAGPDQSPDPKPSSVSNTGGGGPGDFSHHGSFQGASSAGSCVQEPEPGIEPRPRDM